MRPGVSHASAKLKFSPPEKQTVEFPQQYQLVEQQCLFRYFSKQLHKDVYVVLTNFRHLLYFFYRGNPILWCTINKRVSMPHDNSLAVLNLHGCSLQIAWVQENCLNIFDNLPNLFFLYQPQLPDGSNS